MRSTIILAAALTASLGGATLIGTAQAQTNGNLGTTQTQPQTSGGVAVGPGAPTSASPAARGPVGVGATPPGARMPDATPEAAGRGPALTPGGAIAPGGRSGSSGG